MRFEHGIATLVIVLAATLSGCKDSPSAPVLGEDTAVKVAADEPAEGETPMSTIVEHGFIQMPDGERLRYSVKRPETVAPVPVILQYTTYAAGANQSEQGVAPFEAELIRRGYALVGLNARGTGCSSGAFGLFDEQLGVDGAHAVEWIAEQSWSDGRIGMLGFSAGGITQFYVAGQRPPHLRAIAPGSTIGDLYRDVVYVGGTLEYNFPMLWTPLQKGFYLADAAADPDPECAANYAQHEVNNATPDGFVPTAVARHPFYDDAGFWADRMPNANFPRIDVPTYLFGAWQDEQLAARVFGDLSLFRHPDRLWVNFSNGNHGRDLESAHHNALILDFLDRFVRDVDNGFEQRVARLTLAMETVQTAAETPEDWQYIATPVNRHSWDIERASFNALQPKPRTFYLRSAGLLAETRDIPGAPGAAYRYPMPSPGTVRELAFQIITRTGTSTAEVAWKIPVAPGGALAYTTAPLESDLVIAGPASLDLWMTSTAADTDLQATLTEVRPDGQEMYVQRGFLRASHRKLDPKLSTELRPFHTHLRADQADLPREPALLRIEILPVAHAFRTGSRLRLWIDAPTGHTGLWAFQFNPEPATNTVLHDAAHPSRLVLGELKGEVARAPLPACDTLTNQPCRPDPLIH